MSRTLEEHRVAGREAIDRIASRHLAAGPQRVCHHFDEIAPVDPLTVSVTETYSPFVPLFAAIGLEFLADRLEAWEFVEPDLKWLSRRMPVVLKAATEASLIYRGWTWEPQEPRAAEKRECIGTTDFSVIDNR